MQWMSTQWLDRFAGNIGFPLVNFDLADAYMPLLKPEARCPVLLSENLVIQEQWLHGILE